jgi:hypothetical protein
VEGVPGRGACHVKDEWGKRRGGGERREGIGNGEERIRKTLRVFY